MSVLRLNKFQEDAIGKLVANKPTTSVLITADPENDNNVIVRIVRVIRTEFFWIDFKGDQVSRSVANHE